MRKLTLALCMAAAAVPGLSLPVTTAQAETGNDLQLMCGDEIRIVECLAYIRGVTETDQGLRYVFKHPQAYCFPDGITMGQVNQVVLKYLAENPSELHMPGPALIMVALARSFPCQ